MTDYDVEDEFIEDEVYEDEPDEDDPAPQASDQRSWMLLVIVLIIGLILLGLFALTRPTPIPLPPMKPPWLV